LKIPISLSKFFQGQGTENFNSNRLVLNLKPQQAIFASKLDLPNIPPSDPGRGEPPNQCLYFL